jgi:hypothetical protein
MSGERLHGRRLISRSSGRGTNRVPLAIADTRAAQCFRNSMGRAKAWTIVRFRNARRSSSNYRTATALRLPPARSSPVPPHSPVLQTFLRRQ